MSPAPQVSEENKPPPVAQPLRIILAGGGTGGHLIPGVALLETLEQIRGRAAVKALFVGTARGIEARLVPALGYALATLPQGALLGVGFLERVRTLFVLPWAFLRCLLLLWQHRPHVVVGLGGYASGPMTLCAALCGIPTVLLEQNAVAGRTNRWVGRFARRVLTHFAAAEAQFPSGVALTVGNPLRPAMRAVANRAAAERAATERVAADRESNLGGGNPPDIAPSDHPAPHARELRLLVMGGSQGARAINEVLPQAVGLLSAKQRARLQIRHQTGTADVAVTRAAYNDLGFPADVFEFVADPAPLYAWADAAVCRAGAGTVAELAAFGLPALLVPYPFAADDHQRANAEAFVALGGGIVIPQAELTPQRLAAWMAEVIADPAVWRARSQGARAFDRPGAAQQAAAEVLRLAGFEAPG